MAQAVALIEGFLDKVLSSSNLPDTWSHENTRALQGVEVRVDGLLSQVGTKAAEFPEADDAPSLSGVIHSLASDSEVGKSGAPGPTAVKWVVRQAVHVWWESCKGSLVHKDTVDNLEESGDLYRKLLIERSGQHSTQMRHVAERLEALESVT